MSFKTTAVLLLLASALAGFYFFVERDRPTTEEMERSARKILRDLRADEVVKLAVARPGTATAEIVVAREKGTPWRLEKPIEAEVEAHEMDSILSTVTVDRTDLLQDADPHALGLDAPRLDAVFTLADGTERRLRFGKSDLSGSCVYARVEGGAGATPPGQALLVPKRVFDALAKTPADLRKKALFSIDEFQVDGLTLRGPQLTLRFRKDGELWRMEEPEQDFADKAKVEEAIRDLAHLEAKRFVDEKPANLAAYGLAIPHAAATLEARGVSETALLGGRAKEPAAASGVEKPAPGEVYAKRADRPNVVAVEDAITKRIVWDAEAWRSRQLLHVGIGPVEAILVEKSGAPLARIVREGEGWRFAAPVTATADTKAVEDLVRAIRAAEIQKVITPKAANLGNFGLDDPLRVALETPRGKHVFLLGRSSPRENGWYAQREGKDAVFEVTLAAAKSLAEAWPALRDRHVASFPESEVVKLTLRQAGAAEPTPVVRLPDGSWTAPRPGLDTEAVEGIVHRLSSLEASRVIGGGDPAALGLDKPWLAIEASRTAGGSSGEAQRQETWTLELGKATAERDRYARLHTPSETIYLALPEETVNTLARDLFPKGAGAPAGPAAPAVPTSTAAPAGK
jgi:hypothetical protein